MCHYIKTTAFSLLEIIVTVSIVVILSTMALYSYQDYKIKAQLNSAFMTAEQLKLTISGYYAKNKECPTANFIQKNLTVTCPSSGSIPCINNITNTGCTLNLANGATAIISFQAKLSSLGDLQYFCVKNLASLDNKYLSISCDGLPTLDSSYSDP